MSQGTKIEWTDETWNPWHGCRKIAPECANCYAATFDSRNLHPHLQGVASGGNWTGLIKENAEETWGVPFTWRTPRRVFTCSMSDFFHEDVPLSWFARAFDVMDRTPQHTYQILTKRAGNIARRLDDLKRTLPANVWLGVTIGHTESLPLLKPLLRIDAPLRFLSCEPLLTALPALSLEGIGWVIAGGESGNRARRTEADWVRALRDRCVAEAVPFFFKQWGNWQSNPEPEWEIAPPTCKGGATLDRRMWRQFP